MKNRIYARRGDDEFDVDVDLEDLVAFGLGALFGYLVRGQVPQAVPPQMSGRRERIIEAEIIDGDRTPSPD